jgi:hypothetical protein
MIGIAAASPSGQKVRPSMFSARYFKLSMSFMHAAAGCEAHQRLLHPIRTFAAGNAPAAALVLIKLRGAQGELHDAHLVVETTTPPEPSMEPAFATESKSMATSISSGGGSAPTSRRARRLSAGLPVGDAAGDVVDHLLQVVAHGQLVDAGPLHVRRSCRRGACRRCAECPAGRTIRRRRE